MKSNKIIAVISDNGNVAKSTLTNYCIYPRLTNNPEVIYSESGNSIPGKIKKTNHGRVKNFNATQEDFIKMITYLSMNLTSHDIVVDFGSTDSSLMRALFVQCVGSVDVFDLFVVPHSPRAKQEDTEQTINFLRAMNVPPEKIRVVLTLMPAQSNPENVFEEMFDAQKEFNSFSMDKNAVLYTSLLIDRLSGSGYSVADYFDDKTDYKNMIIDLHSERDKPEVLKKIREYTEKSLNQGLAATMTANLNAIFASIMGKPKFYKEIEEDENV